MSYKIKLEIFEGPLDLLLYLVKKDHLNIYDIPIAKVTEQYLAYLELMRLLDLNIAGEFLVMAATLIQIKSKMLLPKPPEEQPQEQEEDPRLELAKRLAEYQKFKEIAEELRRMEEDQQQVFKRPKIEPRVFEGEDREIYFEASIFDLIDVFSKALKEAPRELFYEVVKDEFTIEEKIHQILHLLLQEPKIKLLALFDKAKNKFEMIVTFLAILELIRLREIIVRQKTLFGEIEILRNKENISPYAKRKN